VYEYEFTADIKIPCFTIYNFDFDHLKQIQQITILSFFFI
jgi:hypothetical protein